MVHWQKSFSIYITEVEFFLCAYYIQYYNYLNMFQKCFDAASFFQRLCWYHFQLILVNYLVVLVECLMMFFLWCLLFWRVKNSHIYWKGNQFFDRIEKGCYENGSLRNIFQSNFFGKHRPQRKIDRNKIYLLRFNLLETIMMNNL